jgi:hypothetical protein
LHVKGSFVIDTFVFADANSTPAELDLSVE